MLLDLGIAGGIDTFLERGLLNLWRTSLLGLYYQNVSRIVTMVNHQGAKYFNYWEIMAELTLTLVMRQNYRIEHP